ncbi:hypothetical protein GCM10009769_23880 [Curtobacterium luteum]|uniref:Uncharacterized protein n=1 Tax=Curtobacterium luteum TaxID=33881 RepID=A0A8H9L0Z7_9MICO|nr:hypothetical protein GCM10009769_23880 [Curtobacterium luteum]
MTTPVHEWLTAYGGSNGTKRTASGAIDPTATAATGSGVRRAANATTAWLTVKGTRRWWPEERSERVSPGDEHPAEEIARLAKRIR